MNILTKHDCPPIPIRSAEWSAWVDGQKEDGPVGRGETEMLAVKRLADELLEDTPPEAIHAVAKILHLHGKELFAQRLESEADTVDTCVRLIVAVFGGSE